MRPPFLLLCTALSASLAMAQSRPLFEENFESGKVDPAVWDQRVSGLATVAVEPVDGAHGRYALHVHYPEMAARSYAFLVATHLPESVGKHCFGRAYMKVSAGVGTTHNPLIFAGEPGWPLSKFHEIGTSRGNWMPSYQENKSVAGQGRGEITYRSDVQPPVDRWFLLEWEFNDDPSAITIWIDGEKLADTVKFAWPKGGTNVTNLVGGYKEFGFGARVWGAPPKGFDVYYDDIAIGAERIGPARANRPPAPIQPKPEDLAQIQLKTEQLEQLLASVHADRTSLTDVAVYAKAGRFLLEFPELMTTQPQIDHSLIVLDQGMERAKQLQAGQPPKLSDKSQMHAYTSAIDGSVQPYHISLPANYDPAKPTRLYVWLHGRQNNTTESEFIYSFIKPRLPGNAPVADQGQIQVDLFGRINGAGWHWAGEADVFEAIAAVKKRFNIDDKRILLRGFSMGGEGAWHIALHHPDEFAAAEIGAGTWSNRAAAVPDLAPYQLAALNIWENMERWALNAFNLPLAGHDGDKDTQTPTLPQPAPGTPNRGQLESSLRTRAQLEKEGFPAEGDPNFYRMKGTPDIFLISKDTGHGTSPLVRQELDAFLKEWGDKGKVSPNHIRFLTYTTRYNRDYWVSVDGMGEHYKRADVDAVRTDGGKSFQITTHNVTRLVLSETEQARAIRIDGQDLKVKPGTAIMLEKGAGWAVAKQTSALHKTHALQGPIDDAFLDPFLLVRPTGTPWNPAVNEQALRSLARFDKLWAKYFRGHPFVKDDKDVTAADIEKYHVVLFGDPGSNKWISKMANKLPLRWTKDTVTMAGQSYSAKDSFPALIYPNPLHPSKYVVLNTGLTIAEREYNGDYGMPRWGDYAIVKVKEGSDVPDLTTAGLFDENWKVH